MLININGAAMEIAEHVSVQNLLEMKKIPDKAVIIELNGAILKREDWESRILKSQDKLELIHILGGG